jgi:hypothetical protein
MKQTFTRKDVAEAFADAWVVSGSPEGAWQAFSNGQIGAWPANTEDLFEMFRQAFACGKGEK